METICIEKKTFEAMMARFEAFIRKTEILLRNAEDKKLQEWLDSQQVCQMLNIGARTLQYLRDNRLLSSTKIDGKIWYKPRDVEKLIGKVYRH